jgi:hypothetical protein
MDPGFVHERFAELAGVDGIVVRNDVGPAADRRAIDESFRSADLRVDEVIDIGTVAAL